MISYGQGLGRLRCMLLLSNLVLSQYLRKERSADESMLKTTDCFSLVSNCYVSIQNGFAQYLTAFLEYVKGNVFLVVIHDN